MWLFCVLVCIGLYFSLRCDLCDLCDQCDQCDQCDRWIVVRSFVLCWLCCWLLVDGRRCVVGCYQLVWVAGLCFIAGNT